MKNQKKKRKNTKGITLIALVITIIVLLILAGITITALSGDNGILTQALRAKEETENAQAIEEEKLKESEDYINEATGAIRGGEWDSNKKINTPALKGNMELVRYENGVWVEDETGTKYSYIAGSGKSDNNSSEWANARVTIDGVDSYFVWIPRYEYKIDSDEHTIDVKFIPTTQTTADEGYIIHPAFTADVNKGGWTSELSGIWVGKYETARVDASKENGGRDTKIKVQPGVISLVGNVKINEIYKYSREYSPSLKSHMLKNSEWGAVAYLTHSQYGRNGNEVTINNSSKFITGSAGNSVDAAEDEGTTNDYTSSQGVLASSTGNVYGIYDLSGGAYEYVASYVKSGNSTMLENGNLFADGSSDEYSTAYEGTECSANYIIGDATYETNGWNNDGNENYFVNYDGPFFNRGGRFGNGGRAGIFFFYRGNGDNQGTSTSFRIALVIK